MKRFHPIAAALFLPIIAGACASDETMKLSEEPGFHAGYGDGCATASEEDKSFSTKRVRDEYEFDNDRAYRAGWRQGYIECRSRVPARNDGGRILGEDNEY